MQLSFVQDGDFGAAMELQVLLSGSNTANYANQFLYDKTAGTLTYQVSHAMKDTTRAVLTLEQSGEYLLVLDTEEFDGTAEEPEEPSIETQPEDTPAINPVDNTPATQQNNDGISAIIIIIIGLIVLGVGLLVIVILRARSRREE